jgi:hypothetical protein
MFGFPRLKTVLEMQADGASLIDVVLGELKHFTGEGSEQEDDVTLVTLQRMLVQRDDRPAGNTASPPANAQQGMASTRSVHGHTAEC